MRRTQNGNNNVYCQDNELGWMNWNLEEKNKGLVRFTKNLIELRKNHPIFTKSNFFAEEVSWFDISAKNPDWNKVNRFLGFKLDGGDMDCIFYKLLHFNLPFWWGNCILHRSSNKTRGLKNFEKFSIKVLTRFPNKCIIPTKQVGKFHCITQERRSKNVTRQHLAYEHVRDGRQHVLYAGYDVLLLYTLFEDANVTLRSLTR